MEFKSLLLLCVGVVVGWILNYVLKKNYATAIDPEGLKEMEVLNLVYYNINKNIAVFVGYDNLVYVVKIPENSSDSYAFLKYNNHGVGKRFFMKNKIVVYRDFFGGGYDEVSCYPEIVEYVEGDKHYTVIQRGYCHKMIVSECEPSHQ